jgi:hypothetical protein
MGQSVLIQTLCVSYWAGFAAHNCHSRGTPYRSAARASGGRWGLPGPMVLAVDTVARLGGERLFGAAHRSTPFDRRAR